MALHSTMWTETDPVGAGRPDALAADAVRAPISRDRLRYQTEAFVTPLTQIGAMIRERVLTFAEKPGSRYWIG